MHINQTIKQSYWVCETCFRSEKAGKGLIHPECFARRKEYQKVRQRRAQWKKTHGTHEGWVKYVAPKYESWCYNPRRAARRLFRRKRIR